MLPHPAVARTASRQSPEPSPSGQIAAVVLTVLFVGFLDAGLVVLRLAGAGGAFEFVPARIWIVAPLIWTFVAALAGAAAMLVTRRWAGVSVALFVVLAFLAIRLRAHPALLAVALVAIGIVAAFAGRWIQRWMALPRRATALGTSGALMAAAALVAAPGSTPSPSLSNVADAPNVMVIFLDTVRYDAVFDAEGQVHDDLETLKRLRADSTVFTRAYAPSPWTLPSHLSAMTGLRPDELGVSFDAQVYERSEQTLAERFRQRGYLTAAVISNSFLNAGTGFARGFDSFQQARNALDICRTAPGLMADTHWPWFAASVCNWTASEVTARARQVMIDDDRPFFLTLNYMDAHDPYYVERACGTGGGYRAAIRCLDRNLALIVDWRSQRRPTILAVLSDHGEQFGEHDLVRHGNSLYVQLLHVPLMIRAAAPAEPHTNATPMSTAVLPVLLGFSNGSAPHTTPVVALLQPPAAANLPWQWSALDGSWHLIVRENGSHGLYHLPSDPLEEHNLIEHAPADPAIARLHSAIDVMRRSPKPDVRRFRSLGYLH